MGIVHIVLFEWKTTTAKEQVDDACTRMLALKEKCTLPESKKPYVKSLQGGRNNSPEGHAGAYTHGFVVEFENEKDREHYLNTDPAHLDFVKFVGGIVQNVKVLDFEPGRF